MKRSILTLIIMGLGLFLLIACFIFITKMNSPAEEVNATVKQEIKDIQLKFDSYLARSAELNDSGCGFGYTDTEIKVVCSFGTISRFNQTHDKVNFHYESSGGSVWNYEKFIPHFEPIPKPVYLKLVQEGPGYLFECNPNPVIDGTGNEKKLPFTIMTLSEADKYVKVSKERCLGYQTDGIKTACINCLIDKMDSLIPQPNQKYCNDFEIYSTLYGKCLGNIASFSSNPNLCQTTDTLASDSCYFQVAIGLRDATPCNNINDAGKKDTCKMLISEIIADVGYRK